jgi:hypothetical protein
MQNRIRILRFSREKVPIHRIQCRQQAPQIPAELCLQPFALQQVHHSLE